MRLCIPLVLPLLMGCQLIGPEESLHNPWDTQRGSDRPIAATITTGGVTFGALLTPSDELQPVIGVTSKVDGGMQVYFGATIESGQTGLALYNTNLIRDVSGGVPLSDPIFQRQFDEGKSLTLGWGVSWRF